MQETLLLEDSLQIHCHMGVLYKLSERHKRSHAQIVSDVESHSRQREAVSKLLSNSLYLGLNLGCHNLAKGDDKIIDEIQYDVDKLTKIAAQLETHVRRIECYDNLVSGNANGDGACGRIKVWKNIGREGHIHVKRDMIAVTGRAGNKALGV